MKDSAASGDKEPVILSPERLRQLAYTEKMAELGKLAAGVASELNATVSVIVSASQMVMGEEGVPDSVKEMIDRISSEAQRLSHISRGLLNFSGRDEAIDDVDLNLAVESVLGSLQNEAERRGVMILKHLGCELPTIRLDIGLLKQVLLNLVMNALRAMEQDGGKLLVETDAAGADRVCLTVSDNAAGAPSEAAGPVSEYWGAGSNLCLTQQLVENMGGSMSVSRRSGGGGRYEIVLPVPA